MQYLIAFLEGIVTFISPCLLPMLPVYVTYFAGDGERGSRQTAKNALGFILGFTLVFVAMGALAGSFGAMLARHQTALNIGTGLVVVAFRLHFLGVFSLPVFTCSGRRPGGKLGFFSSVLFGAVFSVGWTPCVGAFLGSALMLAASGGQVWQGVAMLFCYSLGLGIPFLISALLIDKLKGAFNTIKRHYKAVNTLCGVLLVATGLLMATGALGKIMDILA